MTKLKFQSLKKLVLNKDSNLQFEDDWEKYIRKPSEKIGGIKELLCKYYNTNKIFEDGKFTFKYWEIELKSKNKIFIIHQSHGPIGIDWFVALNKKIKSNDLLKIWKEFVDELKDFQK